MFGGVCVRAGKFLSVLKKWKSVKKYLGLFFTVNPIIINFHTTHWDIDGFHDQKRLKSLALCDMCSLSLYSYSDMYSDLYNIYFAFVLYDSKASKNVTLILIKNKSFMWFILQTIYFRMISKLLYCCKIQINRFLRTQ